MMTAIVVLLCGPADADAVASVLSARLRAVPPEGITVERPPDGLLGLDFLMHPDDARAWWEGSGAASATRWIMVIDYVPGLGPEIDGVESSWIVWCRDSGQLDEYVRLANAWPKPAIDAQAFADAVVEWCLRDPALGRFVRPTWGPFQRAQPGDDARPVRRTAPSAEHVEITGTSAADHAASTAAAGHRHRVTLGPPPVDYVAAPTTRMHSGADPAEASVRDDESAGAARHGAQLSAPDRSGGHAAIEVRGGESGRPCAAVPPPPPVALTAYASVPAPRVVDRAAPPTPPPITEVTAAQNTTGPAEPLPPAPPATVRDAGAPEMAGGERSNTRHAAVENGARNPEVASCHRDDAPPPLPPATVGHVGDAERVSHEGPSASVADPIPLQGSPLDALPVLEPPRAVVEVAEREPRQIALSWLPSSLVRRRRRGAQDPAGGRGRSRARPVATAPSAVTTTRPILEMSEPELRGEAARLLMLGPPLVVVCCSRKGGVGKTYDILGIAELADEAGEAFAVHGVLLEQNLENPDLRVVLGLPSATSTVRQLERALADGVEAPVAAHPTQSGLSVYVEERETGPYSRESIERLARHCRARYGLTAVDLANCLPDVTGGKAAAVVAHWLRAADVVMLPTDASRSGLEGLAEMIDAVRTLQRPEGRAAPGIVIPFLTQPGGRALEYPGIAEILKRYNGQGAQPVAVPFSEETQLAGWENVHGERTTILDDANVRLAYWRLLAAVLRAGNARGER